MSLKESYNLSRKVASNDQTIMNEHTDNIALKRLRQSIGITQVKAAELGRTSPRTFRNWEVVSPRSSRPVPGIALKYFELLDFLVNDLKMPLDKLEKALQEKEKKAAVE